MNSHASIDKNKLATYLAQLLTITQYHDYCPNGLQVEGRNDIAKLVSGVTASQALIEAAVDLDADAILVHHGYFWRNEDPCIIGTKHQRLKALLDHDINLFAYHLPLDGHAELGNNAQLAQQLGLTCEGRFGEQQLGWWGTSASVFTAGKLAHLIQRRLGRTPLLIGEPEQKIGKIAWCTGGAQNLFSAAIAAGASVYISGEISESTVHLARETGVAYIAAGHHATERYGVQALGAHIAECFGIQHRFVDVDNPV